MSLAPVSLDVHSQGTVEPRTTSTLVAQVGGRIVDVADAFAVGGLFRRGQVLVRIDPRDYELAVRDAEAAVAQARVQLEREQAEAELARRDWEELGDGGEPSALLLHKPQLAQARAALEAAQASVERARLNLERTRVSAPFDGRVRAKQADLGQSVAAGTPLADVFATEYAEVRLPVTKEDLAYLPSRRRLERRGARGAGGPAVALTGELGGAARTWHGAGGAHRRRDRSEDAHAERLRPRRRPAAWRSAAAAPARRRRCRWASSSRPRSPVARRRRPPSCRAAPAPHRTQRRRRGAGGGAGRHAALPAGRGAAHDRRRAGGGLRPGGRRPGGRLAARGGDGGDEGAHHPGAAGGEDVSLDHGPRPPAGRGRTGPRTRTRQ